MYRKYFKRLLDFVISLAAIVLLSPLIIIVAVVLCLANGGNPFFTQRRPGRSARIFLLIKFRTMNSSKDANGQLLSDEERLTTVGKMVRKTSLDELPQLFNVLLGDMSLVGPRPLLIAYLPLYNAYQNRRHEVKPGISGWAQVNGRNNISWSKKFELDVWYVEHLSFALDLRIVIKTISKVFKSEDINQQGHATMPYFTGTN